MCRDLSCLFTIDGRLIESFANTSSHEDLVAWCGLPDNRETFVRIEFTPPDDQEKIENPEAWNLRVDESSTPEWFNEERARREIWGIVQGMIVRDERKILMGGCWVVLPSARIQKMAHGKIAWAREANLSGANLSEANLSEANLYGANLYGANLRGANLRGANLYGADLYGANLSGADLRGANLRGANLYGADLYGANLSGADLRGANLYGADLYGANLSGADLTGSIGLPKKE